ncbi:MAG TPA: sigma-54-dependent Fis family transcriptional regulator [Variovorax sp.]|nr:sigma-54-dependent Fis family transcriptional regulator [Variovorax sp.]
MTDAMGMVWRTDRAREVFFNQGRVPEEDVASHIARSWARSRGAGVMAMAATPLDAAGLRERREASRLLLASAQPELDALSEHAVGQGCVVIVTDAAGVILDEVGSPDFLPKAERAALLPGVEWSERRCGTNAIGTVLVERRPLAILGGEHFLAGHGALGCAAAPIFGGRGEIAGVLDISGDAIRIDGHTLGLVRMASQQIEHRMMLAQATGDVLRFHVKPAVLGSPREGLLTVVDGRIVAANRIALALLERSMEEILDQPLDRWFGRAWRDGGGDAFEIALPGGRPVVARRQRGADCRVPPAVTARAERASRPARPEGIEDADPAATREDPRVARALAQAVKVIDAGVAVLVTGETGVGKEVFARRLHAASRHRDGPLVIVNCAALPESLIESELFGYDEGAFTGARRQGTIGRIREAAGGTLMLDEIGDMPPLLQTRLLRVLEDRTVQPLGGGRAVRVDFQLVCATHRDLAALVEAGRFRADLMFRVNGHEAHLPCLRERRDRGALVRRLFAENGGRDKRVVLGDDAFESLERHAWPGNVRELVGVLRTLVALADPGTEVAADALPARFLSVAPPPQTPLRPAGVARSAAEAARPLPLADVAQQEIALALAATAGNVARAASRLGVHRSTVYRHLERARRTP